MAHLRSRSGGIPAQFSVTPKDLPEIKLDGSRDERFLNDALSDLYAILVATEHLETLFVRDLISAEEYGPACTKLIAQYRTAKEALAANLPSVSTFVQDFDMQVPAAFKRLERIGVPATVEHGGASKSEGKSSEIYVAAAVQHFITTMDSLKLEMYAVDEVHPHLNDLMESLHKISMMEPDHVAKVKVREWLVVLNGMKASEELSPDQSRQMLFDLDLAYNGFVRTLERSRS